MAFNTMLAIFPSILAILTALGLFEASLQDTFGNLANQYKDVVPPMAWSLLENFAIEIDERKSRGLFSLSFIVAIWISSGPLSTAMNALDEIHQIPLEKRRAFWQAKLFSLFIAMGSIVLLMLASFIILLGDLIIKFAIDLMIKLPVEQTGVYLLVTAWRLLSWPVAITMIVITVWFIYKIFKKIIKERTNPLRQAKLMLIVLSILTLVLLVMGTLLLFINHLIIALQIDYTLGPILVGIWQILSWPVALSIVSIAFGFVYRIGPSLWIEGTPIFPGAILAAISWAGLSALFRLYVMNFAAYNKVYGAVGAVIVLMLWLQMSCLVMLLGDQLNVTIGEAIYRDRGSRGVGE